MNVVRLIFAILLLTSHAEAVTLNFGTSVSDESYNATTWNADTDTAPSKNAVRDKLETIGSASVSDTAYGAGWNGTTTVAPSKNAVYDKMETVGSASVSDTAYDATSWNGVTTIAPSKNAVRDKLETMGGTGDVVGPASNTDNYVPQWNGADSKTLKNGVAITAAGKALIDDANVSAQRTTLELLSAALRNAEDTLTDGANLPDGHAIKAYGDANWGSAYTNLTSFVDQTAWRLFYSNTDGDVTELALGASGTYLKSNGAVAAPTFSTPSGAGDVVGPATHAANYVPQWDGTPNSKVLVAGFAITAAGKALIDDANAAAQRTTLGLGSAALRTAEDVLTDGSNLPDGHAIKEYGDTNWGGGGLWTDAGTYYYSNNWSSFKVYDSGKLDMASSQWVYDDDSISYTGIGCGQIHRYNQLIKNFSMNHANGQVLTRIEGKSSGGHDALALMTAIQLSGTGQGWGSNPMIDIQSTWQPTSTKWAVGEEIDLNLRSNTSNGLSQGLMITGISTYAPTVAMSISMGTTDWKDGIWMSNISDNGIVFLSNPAPDTGIRFDYPCSNANFWQNSGDMKFHDPNAGTKTLSQLAAGGSGLNNVVEDLTPELGGDLYTNNYEIVFNNNKALLFKNTGGSNRVGMRLNSSNDWHIGFNGSGVFIGTSCTDANPVFIRVGGVNNKQIFVDGINTAGDGYRRLRVVN